MGLLGDYLPSLPTDPNQNSAARQGLLQFGAALLGGKGNFGSILGQGLAAGAGGYHSALSALQQKALQDAQARHLNIESDTAQAALDESKGIAAAMSGSPSAPAVPSAPAALVSGAPAGLPQLSSTPQASTVPDAKPLSMIPPASAAPVVAPATAAPAQVTEAQKADRFEQFMAMGDKLRQYPKAAKVYYDMAEKFKPEVLKTEDLIDKSTGNPVHVMTFKDGSTKVSPFGAMPDNQLVNLGGKTVLINKQTGAQGASFNNTQTPDSVANNATQIKVQNMIAARQEAADKGEPEAKLAGDELRMMAGQYLAGDPSVMMNLGRGKQGAENIVALRREITKQAIAAGMSGPDIAAKMAEFAGAKAGMRTAGTRNATIEIAASEVNQLAPIALEASANVARSGFMPFGKAGIMFDASTNDPNLRKFAMANNALVNAYGQAMARGGTATVNDKQHAEALLSTAMDQKSYNAAVQQLLVETKAAQAAPKEVTRELSKGISGKGHDVQPVGKLPQKGGVPSDISSLLNKYGNR